MSSWAFNEILFNPVSKFKALKTQRRMESRILSPSKIPITIPIGTFSKKLMILLDLF